MSAPPDVRLTVPPPWFPLPGVSVPEVADRDDVAAAAWSNAGVAASKKDLRRLAKMLADIAVTVSSRPVIAAFALIPEPETGVSAVSRLSALDLGADYSVDELLDQLVDPPERMAGPPETSMVNTAAGVAYRLHFRSLGSAGQVMASTVHLWHFPEQQAAVTLDVGFTDLPEAARWSAAVEDLATRLALVSPEQP